MNYHCCVRKLKQMYANAIRTIYYYYVKSFVRLVRNYQFLLFSTFYCNITISKFDLKLITINLICMSKTNLSISRGNSRCYREPTTRGKRIAIFQVGELMCLRQQVTIVCTHNDRIEFARFRLNSDSTRHVIIFFNPRNAVNIIL